MGGMMISSVYSVLFAFSFSFWTQVTVPLRTNRCLIDATPRRMTSAMVWHIDALSSKESVYTDRLNEWLSRFRQESTVAPGAPTLETVVWKEVVTAQLAVWAESGADFEKAFGLGIAPYRQCSILVTKESVESLANVLREGAASGSWQRREGTAIDLYEQTIKDTVAASSQPSNRRRCVTLVDQHTVVIGWEYDDVVYVADVLAGRKSSEKWSGGSIPFGDGDAVVVLRKPSRSETNVPFVLLTLVVEDVTRTRFAIRGVPGDDPALLRAYLDRFLLEIFPARQFEIEFLDASRATIQMRSNAKQAAFTWGSGTWMLFFGIHIGV